MSVPHDYRLRRGGLTLIELLVVIILLTILTASVLPVMAPAVESRRMREAARGVSVFFSTARSRAVQNGRPVGVEIRRMNVGGGAVNSISMALYEVEVPLPYGGDDLVSTASVNFNAPDANGIAVGTVTITAGGFRPALVKVGDRIQFGYQGQSYYITGPNPVTAPFQIQANVNTGPLPWPPGVASPPMPYQVFRQPIRSSSDPYQLPEGIVIDLDGSGFGPDGLFLSTNMMGQVVNDVFPVVVLFAPNGSLTSVYQSNVGPFSPPGDLQLLIGKREKAPADIVKKNYNWLDPNCMWVTVRHQTGQVVGTAMHPVLPATVPTETMPNMALLTQMRAAVYEARFFARESYAEGGK